MANNLDNFPGLVDDGFQTSCASYHVVSQSSQLSGLIDDGFQPSSTPYHVLTRDLQLSGLIDRFQSSSTPYHVVKRYPQSQSNQHADNSKSILKPLETFTCFSDLPQEVQVMIIKLATSIGEPLKFIYQHPYKEPRCEILHSPGQKPNTANVNKAAKLIGAISIFSVNHYFNAEGIKSFYGNNEFYFVRNTQLLLLLKSNQTMRQYIRYVAFLNIWATKPGKELFRLLRECHELREIWFMSGIGHQHVFPGIGQVEDFTLEAFATFLFRDAFPLLASRSTTENKYKGMELFKFHPQIKSYVPPTWCLTKNRWIYSRAEPSTAEAHDGAENEQLQEYFQHAAELKWDEEEKRFHKYEKKEREKSLRGPRKPDVAPKSPAVVE